MNILVTGGLGFIGYNLVKKLKLKNHNVITLLKFHSFIIFIGNIPLFIVIFVLLFIKIASFISAYMCPGLLISLSKMCPTKMVKYESKSFA